MQNHNAQHGIAGAVRSTTLNDKTEEIRKRIESIESVACSISASVCRLRNPRPEAVNGAVPSPENYPSPDTHEGHLQGIIRRLDAVTGQLESAAAALNETV